MPSKTKLAAYICAIALTGCGWLASSAGQAVTGAALTALATAAERSLAEKGHRIDRAGSICFDSEDLGNDGVPSWVCVFPKVSR